MRHPCPPVMLFAAGFGTRMQPLTNDRPKPLIPVAGRPLIDHALELAEHAGSPRIAANLHYKPDMIESHLQGRSVHTVREIPDILDTGGGLRNALTVLDADTVVTLNSDAIWAGPNPICLLLDTWDPEKMDALLVCVPMTQTRGRTADGDFRIQPDGQIVRGTDAVYAGVQIMKTARLFDVSDKVFSLNIIWNQMAADHRLFGVAYDGLWCDVGHPGGIADAEQMLAYVHV